MSEPATPAAPAKEAIHFLDAVLLIGVLIIIGFAVAALVFANIPKDNLAILASIVSALLGAVIGGYAGFRWGASEALKRAQAPSVT